MSVRFSSFTELALPGVQRLQPYQPGKPLSELEREYGVTNAVKLASNENPLGPSPRVLLAAHHALRELARYPDGAGFDLRNKLAQIHKVPLNQITLGNGSNDVLELIARAFVGVGDEVIFSQHAFAVYPIVTQAVGGAAVVTRAKNWGHDLKAMRAAVTARTRVIFIANPNNPTGTWLSGAALEEFLQAVPDRVLVVVDEAYLEYARHPAMQATDYPDASVWLEGYPNLVVTRTFSKAYGLAGLRAGYALSHATVADALNRVRQPFNVNSVAQAAACAALEDEAHLECTLRANCEGMAQLREGFDALGLAYIPSVGNFICVDMGREAAPVYEALLRQGVIVRPVANYGMPNHLRITIGLREENDRFLAALRTVLNQ